MNKLGIPSGDYCYEVVEYDEQGMWKKVEYCSFWYGSRPDGGCLIYGWDAALGDACKACDFEVYEDE